MADLTITIDQNFPLSFDGFLFNESAIVKNQAYPFHTFHLTDNKSAFARFVLFLDKEEGKSPVRAPFGSIEFAPDLSYEELQRMIHEVEEFCKKKNLKSLSIVSYPVCYASSNSQLLTHALKEAEFEITTYDLNFHLRITNTPFEESLHESEVRRLKKCQKENFEMRVEENPDADQLFDLISRNRAAKGYPVSMKSEELRNLFTLYPGKYIAFTLWDSGKLIASAIGVKVNSKILYYFLPADDPTYKTYSPVVRVIKEMYDYCLQNNFSILDLGIATSGGIANPGLIRFKEHLGGQASLKLSFKKEFR